MFTASSKKRCLIFYGAIVGHLKCPPGWEGDINFEGGDDSGALCDITKGGSIIKVNTPGKQINQHIGVML